MPGRRSRDDLSQYGLRTTSATGPPASIAAVIAFRAWCSGRAGGCSGTRSVIRTPIFGPLVARSRWPFHPHAGQMISSGVPFSTRWRWWRRRRQRGGGEAIRYTKEKIARARPSCSRSPETKVFRHGGADDRRRRGHRAMDQMLTKIGRLLRRRSGRRGGRAHRPDRASDDGLPRRSGRRLPHRMYLPIFSIAGPVSKPMAETGVYFALRRAAPRAALRKAGPAHAHRCGGHRAPRGHRLADARARAVPANGGALLLHRSAHLLRSLVGRSFSAPPPLGWWRTGRSPRPVGGHRARLSHRRSGEHFTVLYPLRSSAAPSASAGGGALGASASCVAFLPARLQSMQSGISAGGQRARSGPARPGQAGGGHGRTFPPSSWSARLPLSRRAAPGRPPAAAAQRDPSRSAGGHLLCGGVRSIASGILTLGEDAGYLPDPRRSTCPASPTAPPVDRPLSTCCRTSPPRSSGPRERGRPEVHLRAHDGREGPRYATAPLAARLGQVTCSGSHRAFAQMGGACAEPTGSRGRRDGGRPRARDPQPSRLDVRLHRGPRRFSGAGRAGGGA